MDIVKQITIMLWILGVVIITPPVLRYFDVDVAAAYRKALFLDSDENKVRRDGLRSEKREVAPEVLENLFSETAAQTAAQLDLAKQSLTQFVTNLQEEQKQAIKAAGAQIEEVPSVFRHERGAEKKVRWLPPPPGFMTADTFNYLIYRERQPVGDKIKTVLDTIHGNLMLDLTPFTLVAKPNKILVMLFDTKESYMSFTKRPAWSGAASDLRADTMYILEGPNFYPLSVHELTHLYFDGYFLPSISPLWLSEGMAVYMQIYVTKRKPSWLADGINRILEGKYIELENMTQMEDLSALSMEDAELWYTQAYTLIDYLLNKHSRDEFYRLCNELKAGTPLHQALYRAYGMPFTKVSVLQNVWLYDLMRQARNKTTKEGNAAPAAHVLSSTQTVAVPVQGRSASPRQTTAPRRVQKTEIKKLKLVETNGYKGYF